MNKKILIGLGVLAVVGIAVYMKKKYKDSLPAPSPEETGNSGGRPAETKANAIGRRGLQSGLQMPITELVDPGSGGGRPKVRKPTVVTIGQAK